MQSDETIISVEGLNKNYEIYERPIDRLKQFFAPIVQNLFRLPKAAYYKEFQALKDISFEVRRGESFAIVGRNGSGKSTLLQIICGTLAPTSGHIKINGRVAALLELGSGFNAEFTGRENVYMNAAILGLTNDEIEKKYQDIVNFADIGEFIDQPVKKYSSGMMLRLAFAVIAHVDADILIIDEALAVGDLAFTQKCMRFIREFQKNKTLILVSHDLNAILNLCDEALWIDQGIVKAYGVSKKVVQLYTQFIHQDISPNIKLHEITTKNTQENKTFSKKNKNIKYNFMSNLDKSPGWSSGYVTITGVNFIGDKNKKSHFFSGGGKVTLIVIGEVSIDLNSPIIGFLVKDRLGQALFGENTYEYTNPNNASISSQKKIKAEFVFHLPYLPNGEYSIVVSIADGNLEKNTQHCLMHEAVIFTVASSKKSYGLVGIPFENVSLNEI
jgi:lipopolysaccharide transport system ATP-binding protein